ncbi:carboxypeptidase-like regulatory domain-containing protein [Colwellia sp. 1_MG-2023]|uniref:beta strand repeat-containing protein n=1 Tax=unclassified Colwellia TaxID=196834 RepID=UPI001C08185C|nr:MULTISPECIES: carboxypeptidase-like regulatory domain-containing protein [unclassified Colwellia]MBU2925425.1 carboxypeptidase-like regulatory domain-containing protein [Colwellia sp. C2M11]MDO6653445.1 carboxypeptidase-like regulatory domain-containing protein [Colwellia sp. 3_MG-2023]MDO6666297.1 carboxypeptidase-like regulatory domain-containing protein [Colwellia sp. 2_MG-2023]MDO6690602.1 carboxypeptidase-like regulatory domain-containing protein [Colwellia sp. 1_MG-2023]
MVNKTQFYKTKVALAVVLSLGLAACGDSDGDANTSTSESVVEDNGGNTSEQAQGTGTVQGTVLDTNGLPVMGATVSLAGSTVTTDASGYYHFTSVPLSGVDGSNNTTSNGSAYTVTITGPDGYASGTVSVTTNNIQIDSGNNGSNTEDSTNNGEQITWFDGFLAQAETANLPMFSAQVTGVLRDCNTGAALPAGVKVALDFTAVTSTGTNGNTSVDLGVPTFTTVTGENGTFSFDALPTDSDLTLAVEGYAAANGSSVEFEATAISTISEGIVNNLGDMEVCLITSNDDVEPYIASVAGSIDTIEAADNYQYVVLSKGIDGTTGITLNFNEAMSAANFDASDVVVTKASGSTSSQIELDIALNTDGTPNVTLAADGMSLTVVLADALDDGQRFSVWFPQWQYTDTSGNVIVTGDADVVNAGAAAGTADTTEDDLVIDDGADFGGSTEFGIASDVFSQQTGKIGYIRTRLCTYVAPSETPTGLTAEQEVKTLDSSLLAVSPLWENSASGTDNVTNLNGQESTVAGKDTGERLLERFGSADLTSITNNTAVIVGSVQNATNVVATRIKGSGNNGSDTPSSTGAFEIAVTATTHGSEYLITPEGAFGVTGDTITVTVEDKVAPTTILQENYELWALEGDYSATTADAGIGAAGSGGEVTEGSVSGDEGDPIIYIQPRHLSPTSDTNLSERYEEFDAFAFDVTNGFTDPQLANDINENQLYSGPGFAAWTGRGNSLGVAFSETIAVGATSPVESASVDLTLTGVLNGLTTDIDGNLIVGTVDTAGNTEIPKSGQDLARFTVADMIAFANNDHNEAIDFTNGSIVDARGNLANANSAARVVIKDAMPAFVTSARWDGSNIIINFNEAVSPKNGDVLRLSDLTGVTATYPLTLSSTATSPTEGAYSLNVAGDELTVAIDASNMSGLFQNGTNDEFVFDSDGDTTTENHLALNWDDIEDTRGNSWSTFDRDENSALTVDSDADLTNDRFGRYLVDAPRFMLYNDVGIFTITKQTIGYSDAAATPAGDDDGVVTVRFSFSHPIDLADDNDSTTAGDQRSDIRHALDDAQAGDYNGSLTLSAAQANNIFQYAADGVEANRTNFANGASFAASFSSDYKVISVTMHEAANGGTATGIVAGTSRIYFWETVTNDAALAVDSAITDEVLSAEAYTVVNSN